jgi:hypothetical protein
VLPGRLGLLILGCRVQGVAKVSERFGLPAAVAKLPVEGEASPQASERLLVPPLPGVDEAEVAEGVSLARSVSAGRRSAAPAAVGWHALAGPAVHEPAISYSVPAGAGGLGQQRREPLDPSVDGHVVDLNPSFSQQLLNVAVRQPEAQAPADREDDDVWLEAEAREGPTVWRERDGGDEISYRQAGCSDMTAADATAPPIMSTIQWFKCLFGAAYEEEPPLCSAPAMTSGSMQQPLRTSTPGKPVPAGQCAARLGRRPLAYGCSRCCCQTTPHRAAPSRAMS